MARSKDCELSNKAAASTGPRWIFKLARTSSISEGLSFRLEADTCDTWSEVLMSLSICCTHAPVSDLLNRDCKAGCRDNQSQALDKGVK